MTAETLENITKTFKFSYPTCSNENLLFKLEVPVEIPHEGSTRELVQRVLRMFHIPVYLEDELNDQLMKFVDEETQNFHNDRDDKLINQLKNHEINVDAIVKDWEKKFKENVVDFADQKGTSDEEVFAGAYHKLVHSPALETILQVENSYAKTKIETLKKRDEDITKLTQRQTEEMEEKMRLLNTFTTEVDINELAAMHFEEQSLTQGRWASELEALGRAQKNELRSWLMTTLEEYQSSSALNTPSNSPLGALPSLTSLPPPPLRPRTIEESFTIHLGSQLKHSHNVRLMTIDLLELCSTDHVYNGMEASRRLQTALALYSSELTATVLVCEFYCNVPSGMEASRRLQTALALYSSELTATVLVSEGPRSALTREFVQTAGSTTEYHFPDVEEQLADVMEKIKSRDDTSGVSSSTEAQGKPRARRSLCAGDVLVTRHANLSDTHVVFHLVADDAVATGDISSRHPAILGLRSILRACSQHDITSVALPMLLTNDVAEGRTLAWCLRRAELVLKCVKGFMVEGCGWGGAPLRTLTLALPATLAAAPAAALAAAPPNVFSQPAARRL